MQEVGLVSVDFGVLSYSDSDYLNVLRYSFSAVLEVLVLMQGIEIDLVAEIAEMIALSAVLLDLVSCSASWEVYFLAVSLLAVR